MFIAALFTIAKTCKQTDCPSTDQWIKKMWYYTMEYTSLVAQMVKCLPTMWETRVPNLRFLGWEDLEKEMATHSSILAWKIPWTEEPGRLQSMGSQSWTRLSNFTFTDIQDGCLRTSLVAQGLRIHLSMQGMWVRSLARELRSHMLWSY